MTILFTKQPLVLNVELAELIGLSEAIVLQQVHYWLENKKNSTKEKDRAEERTFQEGKFWTYNSYEDWQEQFPFWHVDTVKRTFKKLEKKKLLITGNFNKLSFDKTKWYTINYDKLEQLENDAKEAENVDMTHEGNLHQCIPTHEGKLPSSNNANCTDDEGNLHRAIPEITSESSLRVLEEEEDIISLQEVISFSNEKISQREITNQKTIKAINDAITKCKAIGTTNRESMENYVVKVIEEKMALLGQKQATKQPNQSKKARVEMVPDWASNRNSANKEISAETDIDTEEKRQRVEAIKARFSEKYN